MNKSSAQAPEDPPEKQESQENQSENQENQTESQPESRTEFGSTAERVSFVLALAILIGIIGSVGYLWVSDRNQTPPALQVSTGDTEQRQASYYVPFTVTNLGGKTAATVQVIAELRVNNEIVEWGEQTVDFLSREEEAAGAFVFVRNPTEGELIVRVASYSEP